MTSPKRIKSEKAQNQKEKESLCMGSLFFVGVSVRDKVCYECLFTVLDFFAEEKRGQVDLSRITNGYLYDYEIASCPTVYDHFPSAFF